MLEVRSVASPREMRLFHHFPWKLYRNDPLWVPPILSERRKITDPARGPFFKNGSAELFIAWRDGEPAGTICCAEDRDNTTYKKSPECMIGFFECVDD